jgi:segregation and condensation protein A
MTFEEFLNIKKGKIEELTEKPVEKISPNQVYDIVTGQKSDWQTIIYDLINSEQLDPWDIDLVVLTKRYFEKISELEETDFYISSKVLLAAALLLRIKTEFLLNRQIKSIDDILFGKKEEKKYVVEKIELDEDILPLLIPKTPLPRQRKVTLNELMAALSRAIDTETRRIKREVAIKRAKKLSEVDFSEFGKIELKDRVRAFYARILTSIKKLSVNNDKLNNKIGYNNLIGLEREEKIACFLPMLHLSNTQKLWLEQEKHLDEIWIYLYDFFQKNKDQFLEELEQDIDNMKEELNSDFENSESIEDFEEEVQNIKKIEKIEELTGFEQE